MKRIPFPIIYVEGDAYERGYQYGSQCRKLIEESVNVYRKIFEVDSNMDWEAALRLARKFTAPIEKYDPPSIEEMRGIAKGSGQDFDSILAINARTELMLSREAGGLGECTTLAATSETTSSRHMLMAQNWDMKVTTAKLAVILKEKQNNGPNIVQLVEAGIIGKIGYNSAGVCVLANIMVSDGWHLGVPMQIILRKIMNQENLVDAMGVVLSAKRASSGNYLIGYAGEEGNEAVDIEAAPDYYNVLWPSDGTIAHANHFSINNPNIRDLFPPLDPGSLNREHRATKLLSKERGNITAAAIKKILRDHFDKKGSGSICCHVDPHFDESHQWLTIGSLVIDLNDKTLEIAKGPPCENKYIALTFDDIMQV